MNLAVPLLPALPGFRTDWRYARAGAYDLPANSTARRTVAFSLWGRPVEAYANANLSLYSRTVCNGACPFCVEELRPASRGRKLATQKLVETDDAAWLDALEATLVALKPLAPSVSVTGGEPSLDPALPGILRLLVTHRMRKRTMTTNGSGLLELRSGRRVIDWLADAGIRHLNLSRAHPDDIQNAAIMHLHDGFARAQLRRVVALARAGGVRVRLSCVLLRDAVSTLEGMIEYLEFARSLGVDNVVFRQLMKTDPSTALRNYMVRYSDRQRVALTPLLEQISGDERFAFQKQVLGYYYYVEVWRYREVDVVCEEADLAQLEEAKRRQPGLIHELVFHPHGRLASTWQPWDGELGPP